MLLILLAFVIITDSFILRGLIGKNIGLRARITNNDQGEKVSIMDRHLNEELKRLLEVIPIYPETEDDIETDSMEDYLREEFKKICDTDKKINFEKYYLWKKEKGTFLEKNELLEIFNSIVEIYDECKLMEFIKITRIIDDTSEF